MTQSEMLLTFDEVIKKWGLNSQDATVLLGITYDRKARLLEFAQENALPQDVIKRLSHLLDIADCLKALFPEDAAVGWVNRRNSAFGDQTAMDVMLREGEQGIEKILKYLKAYIWT